MLGCCSAALLAACGNSRTPVPSPTQPAVPDGFVTLTPADAGVRLAVPRNWLITGQRPPLVVTIQSGTAVVALWRFARSGPVPAGRRALAKARAGLIARIRRRERSLRLLRASVTSIDGAAAIELQAQERIGGLPRRVSSTHVYVLGAELVLDEYAPPAQFDAVERSVFGAVRRSLTLIRSGGA
jgi:hypothetical protein